MANQLRINVDDFIKDLRAEPASLGSASAPLVRAAADQAASEIQNAYPIGPPRMRRGKLYSGGNLKAGVSVRKSKTDPAVSSGVVLSSAPHAHLYEDGTHVARAHPTFWPITRRRQQELLNELESMVQARGYTVTGG